MGSRCRILRVRLREHDGLMLRVIQYSKIDKENKIIKGLHSLEILISDFVHLRSESGYRKSVKLNKEDQEFLKKVDY